MHLGIPYAPIPDPKRPLDPIIVLLQELLNTFGPNALEQAVQNALSTSVKDLLVSCGITSAQGFYDFANALLRWIPHENQSGKDIYETLCVFYFVLGQDPLGKLQTNIDPASVGKPMTWLSAWIVCYAQLVGAFMDTSESITPEAIQSFINAPSFNMQECVVPPGGFKTFNELFARHLKIGTRPIAEPDSPEVITYPADCTFKFAAQIDENSVVILKSLHWNITDLLQDNSYLSTFQGGIWMHAFLNTFDYHRQHAPVEGDVVEAKVIQGMAYLKVLALPEGRMMPLPQIPSRLDRSGPDAQDEEGYQFLQTRGVIIIKSPVLGHVAVLPIGMAQVSSVKLSVKKGDKVKKGQEISYFQFGGSDCVMLFEKRTGLQVSDFPSPIPQPPHAFMGEQLALAHPTS